MGQDTSIRSGITDMTSVMQQRDVNAENNPESQGRSSALAQQDLVQRFESLVLTCNQMIDRFQDVEPNIDIIYNLKDQFVELEKRTVSIVNQFQNEVYVKEDQADQIILDLNVEVNRIQENIQDLLGLSTSFDSIAEEITRLVQMDGQVATLEDKVAQLEGSTKMVKPAVGTNVPVDKRKDDSLYIITKTESGTGSSAIRYSTYEDSAGRKYYFETNSDQVKLEATNLSKTQLFKSASNLSELITILDSILKQKVYVTTYYATLGTNYVGSSAPYSLSVSVPGIKGTDEPFVGCINADNNCNLSVAQSKAFGNISRIVTGNNVITVYCDKKKPETSLNLRLVVFRTD